MSNRSMLEFNHDYYPRRQEETAFCQAILNYLRSGSPRDLPRGVTWFGMRHHSEDCPLGEPPRGWDNEKRPIEWRRIPGYEAYEVTELGQVRRGLKVLKPRIEPRYRHEQVSIYANGKQLRAAVHRLVALAFIGPPPEDKPFALHKNGRAWENHKDNIYWGNHAENTADMVRHASLVKSVESRSASSAQQGGSNG